MVVAEVLDFPGVLSQGFDLADARVMVASALKDMAQAYLEEGKPLPIPNPEAAGPDAGGVDDRPGPDLAFLAGQFVADGGSAAGEP